MSGPCSAPKRCHEWQSRGQSMQPLVPTFAICRCIDKFCPGEEKMSLKTEKLACHGNTDLRIVGTNGNHRLIKWIWVPVNAVDAWRLLVLRGIKLVCDLPL